MINAFILRIYSQAFQLYACGVLLASSCFFQGLAALSPISVSQCVREKKRFVALREAASTLYSPSEHSSGVTSHHASVTRMVHQQPIRTSCKTAAVSANDLLKIHNGENYELCFRSEAFHTEGDAGGAAAYLRTATLCDNPGSFNVQ